jgi:hypothetical protein
MIKRFVLAVTSLVLLTGTPALAAKYSPSHSGGGGGGGTTTSTSGADVSYPQCGSSLPSGLAFGIVGVNDGLANNFNPCFGTTTGEFAWANSLTPTTAQPKAQLYVNAGNPGSVAAGPTYKVTDWPYNNLVDGTGAPVVNPYGTCTEESTANSYGYPYGPDNQPCAYMFGYNKAYDDYNNVKATANPNGLNWWLDVETGSSWDSGTSGQANNVADLEGMIKALVDQGVTTQVGVYSTSAQWSTIVGNQPGGTLDSVAQNNPQWSLAPAASWLAGARTQKAAQSNCSLTPLYGTTGGVSVTQYTSGGLDYDVNCLK